MIFLTETKCKIRFIYVRFNCKKSGVKSYTYFFVAEIGSMLTNIFNLNFQNKSKRIWAMPKSSINFLSPTIQLMG